MATKDRTALKDEFKNGNLATGERFADLIDSMKVVQLPVVDPQALGTSLSFIDSISQDADGKITATKKTLDLANAHELNPFKGWYKTGDTLPTDGFDGAYLYFKDTSEQTGLTTIYRWNGTTYAPTGTVVDTSNVQTFGSGQQVNGVKIKDENGYEVIGTADVLSAEAGAALAERLDDYAIDWEKEITPYANTEGYINQSTGVYVIHSTPERYHGALVDVSELKGSRIKIIPHNSGSTNCTFAFLQSNVLVENETPSYASGYTTTVEVLSEMVVTVPQDANYMWVYTMRGNYDISPDMSVGTSVKERNVELGTEIAQVNGRVNDVIEDTSVETSLGYGATTDGYILSDTGKYMIYSTPNRYYGKLVDVSELKGSRIKIIPHNSGGANCTFAFLQSNVLVENETPSYASGYTTTVEVLSEMVVTVPQDANYMWVYTYRTRDITPDLYKYVPINTFFPQKFDGVLVSACMGINSYPNRFLATKQLFDIGIKMINNPDYVPTDSESSLFANGSVGVLPYPPASYGQKVIPVLYNKSENAQVAPASVTKVMSIISGLNYISSVKEQVSIISSDIESGSGITMYAGDVMTIEDILYAMMLVSSNTCAQAFGRVVGEKSLRMKGNNSPSVQECRQEFIAIMNAKAASIGMTNSVFTTASGQERYQENLSTTADLLKMVVEACSYPELLRVWGKDSYTISFGGDHSRDELLERTPFDDEFTDVYEYLGCKSGSLSYSEPTVWGTNTFVCVGKLL